MKIAVRFIDWLIRLRNWLVNRQSQIADLQDKVAAERKSHAVEIERLEAVLALRDREIEGLVAINARDLARVEAETAVWVRRKQAAIRGSDKGN